MAQLVERLPRTQNVTGASIHAGVHAHTARVRLHVHEGVHVGEFESRPRQLIFSLEKKRSCLRA